MPKYLKSKNGQIALPIFFPDATKAVVRSLDSVDIAATKTKGILVNTYHLYNDVGLRLIKDFGGVRNFMNWDGGVISDSGGFQVMSLVKGKQVKGKVSDNGVVFYPTRKKKIVLTPEKSIQIQAAIQADMMVVLDDFTDPSDNYDQAKLSVKRTINWAARSKEEFEKIYKGKKSERPYLLAVVQGGEYLDLRKYCTKELIKIGFDGLGYGGWPMDARGNFNYDVAEVIAKNTPKDYFLYGLGIGKPNEIVECNKLGFNIFDCVLPTRDARHKRLYVYNSDSIDKIDVAKQSFFSYLVPDKQIYYNDKSPVSKACDCLLCKNYSRAYLSHLFKSEPMSAMRLATIHNLRFYSILMEKLR